MGAAPSLLAAAVFAFAASSCRRVEAPASSPAAVTVRTAEVESVTAPRLQPVAGTVRPVEYATVAARVMGVVSAADFAVGQAVEPDQVLVTLSAREIDARLAQARAHLDQLTRDHTRETALLEQGASTAESVHALADRRRAAAAAWEEAEALLSYTRVAAPFAGVITRDFVNPGDLATPGSPLFELEALDHFRVEVQLPESLPPLPVGARVEVATDDGLVLGTLAEVSPAADPRSRTRLVKIDLPRDTFARSGHFVRALWPAGTSQSLTVPPSAVSGFGQMERVFVVESGRARLRLVKTGEPSATHVEILSGLDAGEAVIVAPPAHLRDNQRVEVAP